MHRSASMLAWVVAYAALALVFLAAPSSAIGVVSIDYGTEWIKAALVKPGMPFDVVLGRDSKRKVQASVAFKGKVPADGRLETMERIMSGDAYAFGSRIPLQSYHAAKLLLGQSCEQGESPAVSQYRAVYGNIVKPLPDELESGSTCVVVPSEDSTAFWRPEELVGMQLDHMRELAEETSGELLSIGRDFSSLFQAANGLDTVITVPVFYTLHEREALLDAAVLAGFRPHLISDAAAAAASYAHSRIIRKTERYIFYDAGSGAVRATLVEIGPAPNNKRSDANRVTIVDAAWDRLAGGLAMDMLIRDMLADAFDKENPSHASVRQNMRAMARLLREANKVKHVLSANAGAAANIEGLVDDIDLRTYIEREQFEKRMKEAGLLQRFGAPIDELMKRTKLSWNDIASVVLVGGTTRVPSVRAELMARGVPQQKLAQNVNADEAAVMGAALAVASTQPQLRMKPVEVVDAMMYAVNIKVQGRDEPVFASGPQVDNVWNKTLHDVHSNVEMHLYTPTLDRLEMGDSDALRKVVLQGVDDALVDLAKTTDLKTLKTTVNFSLAHEPVGTILVKNALLTVEPPKTMTDSLKSFFGINASEPQNGTNAAPVERRIPLFPNSTSTGLVSPLAGMEKAKSFERLRLIVYEAKQRALRDTAFNELEAAVYQARDMIGDTSLDAAHTKDESERVLEKVNALSAYLTEEADKADAKVLNKKKSELASLTDPIHRRMSEAERRPEAVKSMRLSLKSAMVFVDDARTNLTEAVKQQTGSKYTAAELDTLEAQARKEAVWLEDGVSAQSKRQLNENPVILVDDILAREKKILDSVKRLSRRRAPKTRPSNKNSGSGRASGSTNANTDTTSNATANGTASSSSTSSSPVSGSSASTSSGARTDSTSRPNVSQASSAQNNASNTPASASASTSTSTSYVPVHDDL